MSDTHNSQNGYRLATAAFALAYTSRKPQSSPYRSKIFCKSAQLPHFLVGVGNIAKLSSSTITKILVRSPARRQNFPFGKFQSFGKKNERPHRHYLQANHAQSVADLMIEASIKGIWNFSPAKLIVPASVTVENVDLYSGLAVLCKSVTQTAKTLDT